MASSLFNSILPGEWDGMPKTTPDTNPFAGMLLGTLIGNGVGQIGNGNLPTLPPANANPQPPYAGGNPFASIPGTMPASGFARPEAQAWLTQALGSPYMQGWPQQAGGANGTVPVGGGGTGAVPGTPGAPGTVPSTRPALGSNYSFSGDVSPEAKKIKNQIKKLQSAGKWSPTDIAKIVGAAALTYATGGSTAGILASAISSGIGANAENGQANTNLKQYRTMKDQYLSQIGWSKTADGAWKDASGKKMSTGQVVQTLMNLGVWG